MAETLWLSRGSIMDMVKGLYLTRENITESLYSMLIRVLAVTTSDQQLAAGIEATLL